MELKVLQDLGNFFNVFLKISFFLAIVLTYSIFVRIDENEDFLFSSYSSDKIIIPL